MVVFFEEFCDIYTEYELNNTIPDQEWTEIITVAKHAFDEQLGKFEKVILSKYMKARFNKQFRPSLEELYTAIAGNREPLTESSANIFIGAIIHAKYKYISLMYDEGIIIVDDCPTVIRQG